MTEICDSSFYSHALNVGAILTGFCGTFLAIRIQRESAYYSQPGMDRGMPVVAYYDLSRFPASFRLLCMAAFLAVLLGLLLPLTVLSGILNIDMGMFGVELVFSGILATVVLMVGYFTIETHHYRAIRVRNADGNGEAPAASVMAPMERRNAQIAKDQREKYWATWICGGACFLLLVPVLLRFLVPVLLRCR